IRFSVENPVMMRGQTDARARDYPKGRLQDESKTGILGVGNDLLGLDHLALVAGSSGLVWKTD
ncbi:MAG: hypothetical protein VX438_00250, partial [Planctomycetota bacterium]|nr:hypothetical protein [Planctomycetota bacterium]